ncbi:MAG: hypothetical protein R3F35_11060 [Myxococcota bacterium]
MHRRTGGPRALLLLSTVLAGAAPLLSPAGASAAVRVYHSVADDGEPATSAVALAPAQAGALHLWVESTGAPSSDPAARCANGDGAEICGLLLDLRATGTLSFTSFTADPGADIVHTLAPDRLRLNQLDPIAPVVGRRRLGSLQVVATPASCASTCEVAVAGAQAAGAALQVFATELATPSPTWMTVPEPAVAPAMAAAALLAAQVVRHRAGRVRGVRRRGPRVSERPPPPASLH